MFFHSIPNPLLPVKNVNEHNAGGEVPRLVAVEGQLGEDGRYVHIKMKGKEETRGGGLSIHLTNFLPIVSLSIAIRPTNHLRFQHGLLLSK